MRATCQQHARNMLANCFGPTLLFSILSACSLYIFKPCKCSTDPPYSRPCFKGDADVVSTVLQVVFAKSITQCGALIGLVHNKQRSLKSHSRLSFFMPNPAAGKRQFCLGICKSDFFDKVPSLSGAQFFVCCRIVNLQHCLSQVDFD